MTAASGADQPTFRDQLAEAVPHADWCHEADRHAEFPCVCHNDRLNTADALLPLIEADRERAKAEAQALVMEGLADAARKAPVVFRPGADVDRLLAQAAALRGSTGDAG